MHRTERYGDILRMRDLATVEIKPNDSMLWGWSFCFSSTACHRSSNAITTHVRS